MFKTNSNSDHTLKMTAQVAQVNAFVGRKNPWDGEKRWMRQPFPTIRARMHHKVVRHYF